MGFRVTWSLVTCKRAGNVSLAAMQTERSSHRPNSSGGRRCSTCSTSGSRRGGHPPRHRDRRRTHDRVRVPPGSAALASQGRLRRRQLPPPHPGDGWRGPADGWKPFFFLRPPTTTVIGPHRSDRHPGSGLPPASTGRASWPQSSAPVAETSTLKTRSSHVAGYCVANDVTARGHHKRQSVPADAFVYDWFASKSIDGSFPLGPGITPRSMCPTPRTSGCGCG